MADFFKDTLKSKKKEEKSGVKNKKLKSPKKPKLSTSKKSSVPKPQSTRISIPKQFQSSSQRTKKVKIKDPQARSKAMKARWAKIKASPEWNAPEAVAKRKAEASARSKAAWAKRKADPSYWTEEAIKKRKQEASARSRKAWEKKKADPAYWTEEAVLKRKAQGQKLQAWKEYRKLEKEGKTDFINPEFISEYDNLDDMISEQEIIIRNAREDLSFLDSVSNELKEYKPSSELSERLQQLKEADATTLETILDNAIARDGKEAVARRLNETAGEFKELMQSILYDSGSKSNQTGREGFQVKVNNLARIINGAAMSLDDTKEISGIFDRLQRFDM